MRCRAATPFTPCTRTWPADIVPDSGRSTYVNNAHTRRAKDEELTRFVIQILKVVEVERTDAVRRPHIKQLLTKDLKFPLPHRNPPRANKKVFAAQRPATFY